MNRAVRSVALTGMWLSLVIAIASVVIGFIVAKCDCSYCDLWDCVRHSFGLR